MGPHVLPHKRGAKAPDDGFLLIPLGDSAWLKAVERVRFRGSAVGAFEARRPRIRRLQGHRFRQAKSLVFRHRNDEDPGDNQERLENGSDQEGGVLPQKDQQSDPLSGCGDNAPRRVE